MCIAAIPAAAAALGMTSTATAAAGAATAAASGFSWMSALSMAATAVSTGMSVVGAIQKGRADSQNAAYQAQVNENNAKIAQMQKADALARGKQEEDDHRMQVRRMLGQQRAGIAGSGFDLGDTTSQDILGDTAAMGEYDALQIRTNAEREAWGYEVQSSNALAEANLNRNRARNARSSGLFSAGGSLLEGAAKFGSTYKSLYG